MALVRYLYCPRQMMEVHTDGTARPQKTRATKRQAHIVLIHWREIEGLQSSFSMFSLDKLAQWITRQDDLGRKSNFEDTHK